MVQSTIGSPDSLACTAKPSSPALASSSEASLSSAGVKLPSEPSIERESSAKLAPPFSSASWEEAVSSGTPPRGFLRLRPARHQRAERYRQDGGQKQLENLLGGLRGCAHVILPRCAVSHGVNVTTSEGCLVPALIKWQRVILALAVNFNLSRPLPGKIDEGEWSDKIAAS